MDWQWLFPVVSDVSSHSLPAGFDFGCLQGWDQVPGGNQSVSNAASGGEYPTSSLEAEPFLEMTQMLNPSQPSHLSSASASFITTQRTDASPDTQASAAPSSTTPLGPPGGGLLPERSEEGHRLIVVQTLVGKSQKWVTETLKSTATGNEICNLGNHPRDCPVQLLLLGSSRDDFEDGGGSGMASRVLKGKGRVDTQSISCASAPFNGTVASSLEKTNFCVQPLYLKSHGATECWEPVPLPANGKSWAEELDSRNSKWLSAVEKHRKTTEHNIIAVANLDLSKLRSAGEFLEPIGLDQKAIRKCRRYRLRVSWMQEDKEISAETQPFQLWRSSTPASGEGFKRNKRRRTEDGDRARSPTRTHPDEARQWLSSDDSERLRQCRDLLNLSAVFGFVRQMLEAAACDNPIGRGLRAKLQGDFPFALDTHHVFSSRVKTGQSFEPVFTLWVSAVPSEEPANGLSDNTGSANGQGGTPHGGNASGTNYSTPGSGHGALGSNLSYSYPFTTSGSGISRGHSATTPSVITDTESELELGPNVEEDFSPPPDPADSTGNESLRDAEVLQDAPDRLAAQLTDVEPLVFQGSCSAEYAFEDAMEVTRPGPRIEDHRSEMERKWAAGEIRHDAESDIAVNLNPSRDAEGSPNPRPTDAVSEAHMPGAPFSTTNQPQLDDPRPCAQRAIEKVAVDYTSAFQDFSAALCTWIEDLTDSLNKASRVSVLKTSRREIGDRPRRLSGDIVFDQCQTMADLELDRVLHSAAGDLLSRPTKVAWAGSSLDVKRLSLPTGRMGVLPVRLSRGRPPNPQPFLSPSVTQSGYSGPIHQHPPLASEPGSSWPPDEFGSANWAPVYGISGPEMPSGTPNVRGTPKRLATPAESIEMDPTSMIAVRSHQQIPVTLGPSRSGPACTSCRLRKLRCTSAPGPCDQCVRRGKECVFESTRTSKRGRASETEETAYIEGGASDAVFPDDCRQSYLRSKLCLYNRPISGVNSDEFVRLAQLRLFAVDLRDASIVQP